jgi:RHS repeat-associated protein
MALTRNTYQRNSTWNAPYTFSGKEKDAETGYGYFGARYYDSGLSIWLSVDPMSDKYPSMSPYNYCANNPVILVDPDGREFSIAGIIYVPGANCPDEITDEKYRAVWNTMNKIYSTKYGKKAIDEMNVKGVMYEISIDSHPEAEQASGSYVSNSNETGGTIYLNGKSKLDVLAHEMFHGYQDFHGQGFSSIQNEVEARIFADMVSFNHLMISSESYPYSSHLNPLDGNISNVFNYNVNKIKNKYEDYRMDFIVSTFKSFYDGYEKLPLTGTNQKSLIKNFINN